MSSCNDAAAPEQLCYIPCNFCNIVLAVSVPCSSLYEIVTVRCGHCTNLWSVNMAAAFHHSLSSSSPPSSPWQDHHAQVPNYTSSEYMGNGSSSKFNHKMPTRSPITTSIEERIVNRQKRSRGSRLITQISATGKHLVLLLKIGHTSLTFTLVSCWIPTTINLSLGFLRELESVFAKGCSIDQLKT